MKIAVVYQTIYGTTKQYAIWIKEELGADIFERNEVDTKILSEYDCVIYGGGLYAGGILGVSLVNKHMLKNLIVFTVGLASPKSTNYSDIISKGFKDNNNKPIRIFHFRGGIDYKNLSFIHKAMMGMLKNKVKMKPVNERSDEDRLFLETYGNSIDFTNRDSIKPLVEYVKSLKTY